MEKDINMDETLEKDINDTTTDTKEANTPSEIDTSWIDTFSDDYTNDTSATPVDVNDKRDRDRSETAIVEEKEYDPFDTTYFDEPSDDYLKEAQSNVQNWNQKAREDAMAGMQLAYNDEDLKKHIKNIEGIKQGYKEPGWFDRTVRGALPKDIVDATIDSYKQGITSSMNDSRARPMDNDISETDLPDAIKKARQEYDKAMEKAQDIEANGKTALPGMSAEQERQFINGQIRNVPNDLATATQIFDNLKKQFAGSEANKELVDKLDNFKETKRASIALYNTPQGNEVQEALDEMSNAVESGDRVAYNKAQARFDTAMKEFDKLGVKMDALPNADNPQVALNMIGKRASTKFTERTPTAPTATEEPTPETEPGPMADPREFEEMFQSPNTTDLENTDSYGAWNGIKYDMKGAIRDPNTGALINEPDEDRRGNITNTSATTTPEDNDRDSRIQLHNEELNNFLPVEIINTNPENVNGVAEALANNDTDTAEYLLANSLSGNNFIQLIESATLGNKTVSPELMAVLQSIWAKLQSGQSVGAINSADLSNVSRERSDAITKAFNNYSESSLKDLDYYNRDTNATDESAYNKGLTENTNEVVSDVMKKYVVANPWIVKAVSKWSK